MAIGTSALTISTSSTTRLAVGLRDAKAALGEAFLRQPELGIGALFDLCLEDRAAVRDIARIMRSPSFDRIRESLELGKAVDESILSVDDRWVVGLFNYAYGFLGLSLAGQSNQRVMPAKGTDNSRLLVVSLPIVAVICSGVFLLLSKTHPSPKQDSPSIRKADTHPESGTQTTKRQNAEEKTSLVIPPTTHAEHPKVTRAGHKRNKASNTRNLTPQNAKASSVAIERETPPRDDQN